MEDSTREMLGTRCFLALGEGPRNARVREARVDQLYWNEEHV